MSRNFALLRIVGNEQEYVQTASETPELLDVPVHPLVPKTFPPDSTHQRLPEQQERDQQPLRFEMEGWQLEELTKLMRRISGARSPNPTISVVLASSESGNGCSWICARAGELLATQVDGRVCLVDANFGRAKLHEDFGVPNHHGLLDALRQERSMGGYVSQLSRRNLASVSAGTDFSAERPDRSPD